MAATTTSSPPTAAQGQQQAQTQTQADLHNNHDTAEPSSSRSADSSTSDDDLHLNHLNHHQSDNDDETTLLNSDPLDPSLQQRMSFKRKPKPPAPGGLSFPKFLSVPLSATGRQPSLSPSHSPLPTRAQHRRNRSASAAPDVDGSSFADPLYYDDEADERHSNNVIGGAAGVDWNVEGPGRRVGYDDMTAIDWIFEYAKERQRLRLLYSSASGILGHIKQLADASQIWIVLILTGLASGWIAAFIDVASDWLGDLKTGYCRNEGGDGRFYLNKVFCCWGYDELAQCSDWHPWSSALGATSKGGSYVVEYLSFVLLSVLFAACASILVKHHAIYAKHSGIPEIKTVLGGFVIRYFMGTWTLVIKSLGLCLAVASGLWLGKEGPLVHVACCCANVIMKLFSSINNNEARKREVLSAAAAAGISVAFGAPVGGVLFSLEQLSYYFPDKTMWQSFVCAMLGAVALHSFDPFRTNKLVLYQVTYHTGWHGFEIVPFAFLGIIGGLYGGLFIKLNLKIAQIRRNNPFFKGPIREVVAVSLITAIIGFPIKFMRAQASELLYVLFAECVDIQDDQLELCKSGKANTGVLTLLIVSAFLGFLLASVTFGLLIPAGILLPSMAIGALYGRAVGLIVSLLQKAHPTWYLFAACEPDVPCVTPGTYAIIGAASAIGGATRMTVSIVVIMFELTGALTYVLPIMVAVMISKWVGDFVSPRGIYEAWIHFNGYPFLDNRDSDTNSAVPDVPASQVMTRMDDLVVITATGHTIQSLRALLAQHSFRGFPVIDNPTDALLLGYISRTELAYALSRALARGGPAGTGLPPHADAYFAPLSSSTPYATAATTQPSLALDLRPWMDQTPITLNARSSLQLTVNMFSRLGLRYVLFVERGCLRGLMTKKDVWFVLNEADPDGIGVAAASERNEGAGGGGGATIRRGGGVLGSGGYKLRTGHRGEERGLLSADAGVDVLDDDDDDDDFGSDDEFEHGEGRRR
ncbi:voltage gated chloride channel [Phyllosticta paracitricarpa]|uniref:Chloride channel protein n=1 Tax=Phyllosticta paracitricarpa TaxID=2016321 RepID=A0ABR1N6Z9_9PEZI